MSPDAERREFTLARIAEHVGGSLEGSSDVSITGLAGIEEAGPGDLTFVANPKYRSALESTQAAGVLVSPDLECPPGLSLVRVEDPYAAMMRVLMLFDPGPPPVEEGVHSTAVVAPDAELGEGVGIGPHVVVEAGTRLGRGTRVGPLCFIGAGAETGEDCYLHARAYVGRGCRLGDRVILQPGVVLGSDGFGYAPVEGRYHKIPQLGIVEVADDVEIGANTCIDRGTMGATRIGRGTKIDNLVHIAHNVAIAEDCALSGQLGVAGSARIGKGVRTGGQVGIAGHIRVGDGVSIAGQAGVTRNVPEGESVSGYPARPHREALRLEAHLRRLPELNRRLRALEDRARSEENEAP